MDHRPGCGHRELAVGWALHCLEPEEEGLFASHLPGCADCRRVVEQTEEVGVSLALAVPDLAPPADLEQRVLAATTAPGSRRQSAVPSRRHASPPKRRQPLGRLLTAAAAIALVALSVGLGVRVSQLDEQRDQLAGRAEALSEVMNRAADPDVLRISLVDPSGTPVAMVLDAPAELTLVPVGLPENRVEDQVYVLWGLGAGQPVALRAFDVAPDAPLVHTVGSEAEAGAFTAYGLSLESGKVPPVAPSEVMASGQVES